MDVSASMPDLRAHGFYRPRVGMASRHPDEMPRQEGEAPVPYKAVQRPVMGVRCDAETKSAVLT